MIVLGLTGGIAMGKSTTAGMFKARGIPVWDADAAVHELYSKGGAAVPLLAGVFPSAIEDGAVNRTVLKAEIAKDQGAFEHIEAFVHPLVGEHRARFLAAQTADIIVLDVPLLFELGSDALCNYTIVVSVPAEIQKKRAFDRPGLTETQFQTILAKQMPDDEKRKLADFVIEALDLNSVEERVDEILEKVTGAKYARDRSGY